MEKVYILEHSYEYEVDDGVMAEQIKTIGIYSSEEKAEQARERYKTKKGFNSFPIDCFYISEYKLNEDHWRDGFVTYDSEIDDRIE